VLSPFPKTNFGERAGELRDSVLAKLILRSAEAQGSLSQKYAQFPLWEKCMVLLEVLSFTKNAIFIPSSGTIVRFRVRPIPAEISSEPYSIGGKSHERYDTAWSEKFRRLH
jgi:hypothetical protein